MLDIILANEGFWINLMIPFIIGGIMLFHSKGEYILKEFGIQMSATLGLLLLVYFLAFRYGSDMYSTNIQTSNVKQFEHYDDYTSIETYSCGTSKAPRTCTRTVYHDDEYYIVDVVGNMLQTSVTVWNTVKREFGSTGLVCSTEKSWEGSTYCSVPNKKISMSTEHSEINYIKASALNILKAQKNMYDINASIVDGSLQSYPNVKNTKYGRIYVDRIIGVNNRVLENHLSNESARIGRTKQVNPLIYVVQDKDRMFTDTLKSYWNNGEKNDAILIVSLKDNKVQWSDTIAWTKNQDFLVNSTTLYKGMTVNKELVDTFIKDIEINFKRTPMSEFKYLENEISLSIWVQLLILLVNGVMSFFLYRMFLRN